MKIFSFKIKKQNRKKTLISNIVIFSMLFVVFAFSYAGGTLQVFNTKPSVEAIYSGNPNTNKVSLMINVYWGTEYIEQMLEIMKSQNCTTTFFVGGVWASKNQNVLNQIVSCGHELGNHGYYHKDQNALSADENYREIFQTQQIIESMTGLKTTLFAPPSGAYNTTTLSVAKTLGYKTIMWSKDTIDWRDQDKNLIIARATKNLKSGDLVLMHPTAKTVEALPEILEITHAKKLSVCPVSQVLA